MHVFARAYLCANMSMCPYEQLFCMIVQDMKMIDDKLTTEAFVEILKSDDPKVTDEYGSVNLELEVCLLVQN